MFIPGLRITDVSDDLKSSLRDKAPLDTVVFVMRMVALELSPNLRLRVNMMGFERQGKTSFVRALFGETLPRDCDRTVGVEIRHMSDVDRGVSSTGAKLPPCAVTLFDFGGHVEYFSLQRSFLVHDCVHVVTVNLADVVSSDAGVHDRALREKSKSKDKDKDRSRSKSKHKHKGKDKQKESKSGGKAKVEAVAVPASAVPKKGASAAAAAATGGAKAKASPKTKTPAKPKAVKSPPRSTSKPPAKAASDGSDSDDDDDDDGDDAFKPVKAPPTKRLKSSAKPAAKRGRPPKRKGGDDDSGDDFRRFSGRGGSKSYRCVLCNAALLLLCCAVLCCAVLCCAVLCCAVLCCAIQCNAVLLLLWPCVRFVWLTVWTDRGHRCCVCREAGDADSFDGEDEGDAAARRAEIEASQLYCVCNRPRSYTGMVACQTGNGGCNGCV
jgi:hypothetical protein